MKKPLGLIEVSLHLNGACAHTWREKVKNEENQYIYISLNSKCKYATMDILTERWYNLKDGNTKDGTNLKDVLHNRYVN
jgi:hypothetical protein